MGQRGVDSTSGAFPAAVSRLLRAGVTLSAVVAIGGLTLDLLRHGGDPPHYRVFVGEPAELRSVWGVLHGAAALDARALIQLGLLILIATPVARVVFSAAAFALERDRVFVALTALVLAALVYSLAGRPP